VKHRQCVVPAKSEKTVRAVEVKKHAKEFGNNDIGRVMMAVDGGEEEVRKIAAILDAEFSNTTCEEDGDKAGEISISYIIDRSEKAYFMACYSAVFEVVSER
jgi:hypothetical protein